MKSKFNRMFNLIMEDFNQNNNDQNNNDQNNIQKLLKIKNAEEYNDFILKHLKQFSNLDNLQYIFNNYITQETIKKLFLSFKKQNNVDRYDEANFWSAAIINGFKPSINFITSNRKYRILDNYETVLYILLYDPLNVGFDFYIENLNFIIGFLDDIAIDDIIYALNYIAIKRKTNDF